MLSIKKKPKVIVAMSGGVDSSVAAVLLKKQGYNPIGVFMLFWSDEPPEHAANLDDFINRCCSREAEEMARRTAGKLNIPFYVINVRDEFKKAVVDYFLAEYAVGRTPNPCIACNRKIKFTLLIKKALEMEVDFVATGHYARLRREIKNQKTCPELACGELVESIEGACPELAEGACPELAEGACPELAEGSKVKSFEYHLLKAKDKDKDQSYFLYNLTQEQLAKILFPIGDYKKSQVRSLAKKFNLAVYNRPESQEICFIIDNDIRAFLARYLELRPGPIVTTKGEKIGTHEGLALYTIGQRKGIGIGGSAPYYVVSLDYKNHMLVVTDNKDDPLLYKKSLLAGEVNWISGSEPKLPLRCQAAIRYRHKPAKATIKRTNEMINTNEFLYRVEFDSFQRAVTPGQSVAFYNFDEVLGGGIIFD